MADTIEARRPEFAQFLFRERARVVVQALLNDRARSEGDVGDLDLNVGFRDHFH